MKHKIEIHPILGIGGMNTLFMQSVTKHIPVKEELIEGLIAETDTQLSTGVVEQCNKLRTTIWSTGVLQADPTTYKQWLRHLKRVLGIPWYIKITRRSIISFYTQLHIRQRLIDSSD